MRQLLIFARVPEPGRCKTRLCPPLTGEEAAALARAFLLDEIRAFSRLPGTRRTLLFTPAGREGALAAMLPDTRSVGLRPQGEGDLGERLVRALQRACAGGGPVAVVGSDSPDLPPARLEAAFELLERGEADLVLGPARDGGYYVIALRRPHPELFRDIPWSTDRVCETTVRRATEAGLRVTLLEPWEDVDEPEDLIRLRMRLETASPEVAPHTRRALAAIPR